MFTILELVQPETLSQAYQVVMKRKTNTILGGCAYLKMGSQRIGTAIDLSALDLNYIKEQDDCFEIGAMTPLRAVEIHPGLNDFANGILPKALRNIIGVQFRNVATVGASVYSKYGFSDLITALLVLDTEVELYNAGRMTLTDFLARPFEKDILVKVLINKQAIHGVYQSLRNSHSDYPLINVAVSKKADNWKIAVGARPQMAKLAIKAGEALSQGKVDAKFIDTVANTASDELSFGTNMRATADYRRAMCTVLVKRAILEVLQCK